MRYFDKTSKVSQETIISLSRIFGDSYEQITKKTGLSKKLISDAVNGEDCLTAKHIRKIADGYKVPFAFILLKIVEQKGIPAEEMRSQFEAVKGFFLASAEEEEKASKIYGKTYINWRELV